MRVCCRAWPEPALQQAGGEQQGDEQHDADQDAGERDAELPDLDAEQQRLEPVADVGAGKAPLQHQERQGADDEGECERNLGEARQLIATRRIEAEAGLEHLADLVAPVLLLWIAVTADGEIEQAAHGDDDAGHHQLLGDEARQRDVAEQRQGEDAERDQPQRQLEPARGVSGDWLRGTSIRAAAPDWVGALLRRGGAREGR